MIPRGALFLVTAFWVVMNVLLWRAEYGSRNSGIQVPLDLVCRKILTAPDASSLSVYQDGQKIGFCEFSTSIQQEMANLDADNPPPEGLVASAGYQIRLNGNVAIGDFTNRLKLDGRIQFSPRREWREVNLKLSTHSASVEIHSLATNQSVSVQITSDGETDSRVFTFTDLQNPNTLLRILNDNTDGGFGSGFDLPVLPSATAGFARNIPWEARRDRLMIGREAVSAYRLETRVLGCPIVILVSTLGEILRVELPGGVTATLDEWSKP
ncbi:MAG: hypothetical protein ABSE90_11250 [Verrucomicrobiota bacterium]